MPLDGRSQAMQAIRRSIARLAQTDSAVMIEGEFGTGKEAIAHTLQAHSKRQKGPFVGVNLAAIPRDQVESELFGHDPRGVGRAEPCWGGRFAEAEGGALFSTRSASCRWRRRRELSRVLERGEYVTIGGRAPVKTTVRIVVATSKDLRVLVRQGSFREDLIFPIERSAPAHTAFARACRDSRPRPSLPEDHGQRGICAEHVIRGRSTA